MFTQYLPYLSLILGVYITTISLFWKSKKSKLKKTGIEVEGIIFKQGRDSSDDSVKDNITIRFVTLEQMWVTGEIVQEFSFFYSGQYSDGEKIKIFYDKDDPNNFYVDTKQNETYERVITAAVGLIFAIFGVYILLA